MLLPTNSNKCHLWLYSHQMKINLEYDKDLDAVKDSFKKAFLANALTSEMKESEKNYSWSGQEK